MMWCVVVCGYDNDAGMVIEGKHKRNRGKEGEMGKEKEENIHQEWTSLLTYCNQLQKL